MNDNAVLATVARLFDGHSRWQYSLQPKYLGRISTHTLTMLSNAIDAGWLSEQFLRHENMVELRLTRLGKRVLTGYARWAERAIA